MERRCHLFVAMFLEKEASQSVSQSAVLTAPILALRPRKHKPTPYSYYSREITAEGVACEEHHLSAHRHNTVMRAGWSLENFGKAYREAL